MAAASASRPCARSAAPRPTTASIAAAEGTAPTVAAISAAQPRDLRGDPGSGAIANPRERRVGGEEEPRATERERAVPGEERVLALGRRGAEDLDRLLGPAELHEHGACVRARLVRAEPIGDPELHERLREPALAEAGFGCSRRCR